MAEATINPPRAIRFTLDNVPDIETISGYAMARKPYVTNGGEYMIMSFNMCRGWDGRTTAEVELGLIRKVYQ